MKTRAELAEAVATFFSEYMLFRSEENWKNLEKALDAWRVKPTDPPHEYKWNNAVFNALQMMKNVRDYKLPIEKAITDLASEITYCRGVPDDAPNPPNITPCPTSLSPSDKLSDEEVWMRTVEAAAFGGMWHGVTNIANNVLDAFHERFRKEPK